MWKGHSALKVPLSLRTVVTPLEQLDQVHRLADPLQVISIGHALTPIFHAGGLCRTNGVWAMSF